MNNNNIYQPIFPNSNDIPQSHTNNQDSNTLTLNRNISEKLEK